MHRLSAIVGLAILLGGVSACDRTPPPAPDAVAERAFKFDPELFDEMQPPKPGEWLARFPEQGQSFKQYLGCRPIRPTQKRRRIVILPIGDFDEEQANMLERTRQYASAFFMLPVELADPVALPDKDFRERTAGKRHWRQYKTGPLLDLVGEKGVSGDVLCCVGMTMADLYPDDKWNFVFGQASLYMRVGVYSMARYFPEFDGAKRTPESLKLAQLRAMKVMTHETGHMFALKHCIKYECVMNGSNSLPESDGRPAFLCPDCLHKLQWNIGFDVAERYRKLQEFWKENGFKEQAEWMKRRLEKIEADPNPP